MPATTAVASNKNVIIFGESGKIIKINYFVQVQAHIDKQYERVNWLPVILGQVAF